MGPQEINPQFAPQQVPPTGAPIQQPVQPQASNPGDNAAITGLILAFFIPVVGVIFSLIGLQKSKKAGQGNRLALVGLIISLVMTIAAIVAVVIGIVTLMNVSQKCSELGTGTHYLDSTTKIQCE